MRFAEIMWYFVLAALVAGLGGCATRPVPVPAAPEAVAPVTPTPVNSDPGVVVSPAAQRAFDEARAALNAGHAADAERGFLALTRSDPELGGPHANLGLVYQRSGRLAEAVTEFERAANANPRQPKFLNLLGIAYREQGEFRKAQHAYERAIALDPDYPAPHLNLGILFDLYLWDSARALASYERYLALSTGEEDKVKKWVADIRNRKPAATLLSRKEAQ